MNRSSTTEPVDDELSLADDGAVAEGVANARAPLGSAARWVAVGVLGILAVACMAVAIARGPAVAVGGMGAYAGADVKADEAGVDARQRRVLPDATHRIDINTATAAELDLLPGIGPALAKRIIEYRDEHGAFRRVDDLILVRGIGPKHIDRIRALVLAGQGDARP